MKKSAVAGRLFDDLEDLAPSRESLAQGAVVLRGFASGRAEELKRAIERVAAAAPFRHMETPGGYRMSVAMTNCGGFGWVADRRGYRYESTDPDSMKPWPPLPASFLDLAGQAAAEAGYAGFLPDACLINRYEPGSKLSLHQDRNEKDFGAPIVSVSLGLSAVFLFGGLERGERARRVPVFHGDVVVWGGVSRLVFHGVAPLKDGVHPLMGRVRVNLTLRRAR